MADGLCTGDTVSNVIEETLVKDYDLMAECGNIDRVNDARCEQVNSFYIGSVSDQLFDKLCDKGPKHVEGYLEMSCSVEEDCRKKRCVDRYDSSESSDSGVAVLSCTDCSGSSTASSDITDPGSPYSTGSTHSEDSGTHLKMPPTQSGHHTPWPWAADESPPMKRPPQEKTACFPNKRMKTSTTAIVESQFGCVNEESVDSNQSPSCLISSLNNASQTPGPKTGIDAVTSVRNEKLANKIKMFRKSGTSPAETWPKLQQGKITEYFKSQMKSNGIKKELGVKLTGDLKCNYLGPRKLDVRTINNPSVKKTAAEPKARKLSPVTIPRKILPAPSKLPANATTLSNPMTSISNFNPTVTLTAVGFPSNMAYLHTKAPKPPDGANIFVQQFAAIAANNRAATATTCLLQPMPKLTAINNFNCVKLNGTVVPIVKLNALPSRINGLNVINVETAVPTVLPARPRFRGCVRAPTVHAACLATAPKQQCVGASATAATVAASSPQKITRNSSEEQLPSQDSDSGISCPKGRLEISTELPVLPVESQKSPILSQPKTIRFPAKPSQQQTSRSEKRNQHSTDVAVCRWDECHAQFDTSGALFEHLQVKHVISQATQEQYTCLWSGCRVHGRTSCSRSWLERHVPAHAGTKPFRCIVDGCGLRFNSQLILERHVNNHFNTEGSQSGGSKKSVENGNGSVKLFKRNGKKIRFRRQPWSARMFDFIDSGIMEGLQHRLVTMTEKRTLGQIEGIAGDTVCLQSQVLARRTEPDGKAKVLVRWHPADVVPDEWVNEAEYSTRKTVSIPTLKPSAKNELNPLLCCEQPGRRKQRRKPLSKPDT